MKNVIMWCCCFFQDERPPFDINIYGSFILDNLEKKKTVPFKQIVKHKPTFEICRIFLASLMLVSNLQPDRLKT